MGETEKLLNGGEKQGEEEEEEKQETAKVDEEQIEETKEADEVEEEKKEDGGKEEDAVEDANEEGDSLIENSEDKDVKKCEKKTKKKEPSKWMCGLGKKSSSEKGKKKKEDGKQCKKDERNKEENGAKEEITEEMNGGEKKNGNEAEEKEGNETEAAKEEQHEGDENETTSQNVEEKVVVFVTESEAVGSEAADESKEECFVRGDGLIKATKDKPASFEIHGPEEPHFECKICDQNGNQVAVELERLGENQQKATYCPDTVGMHVIEATWKRSHVLGSPFQVQVEAIESS